MPSNENNFDITVCCTESVDNSAMFLSQGVDGKLVKGVPTDPNTDEEVFDLFTDTDNKVIFYGLVKLPEWFTESHFDPDRMFNDPRKCRAFLNRTKVMDTLRSNSLFAFKYIEVDGENWSWVRDTLHTSKVDLVKANTSLVATVTNSEEYNANLSGVRYACKHVEPTKKYRLFVGHDSVADGGIICTTRTIKKKLSYKETLMHGQSGDVKAALEGMFSDGLIESDDSKGVEAWSEVEVLSPSDASFDEFDVLKVVASKVISLYCVDFCAIDIVYSNGQYIITNITSCPAIQDSEVLPAVSEYFSNLVTTGRKITKEKLVETIMGLTDDEISEVGQLLKGLGKLTKQV